MTDHQILIQNLQTLKLDEMAIHLSSINNNVIDNNLTFIDGLTLLTNKEIIKRDLNTINSMVRTAGFPNNKTIEEFDFSFQPDINELQIKTFANHQFLINNENIVFLGSSGVGKTHLATAIGISAAKKRISTYYIKCNDLINQLRKAKLENRLDVRIKHFTKYKLLIIDEMGYLPIDKDDSNMFFQLIDKRYETKSTIITTNINFNKWAEIFQDPVIANAIVDRLLHHVHVISINGNSYRTKHLFESGGEQSNE